MFTRFYQIICLLLFTHISVFSQNSPNGYNKFFYENGKLSSEGTMRDGKPDGYWKNYYKNGKLKIEGNRKNFLLDSIWKFYDEKGRMTRSINYRENKKDGPLVNYDTTGKMTSFELYKNDLKEGNSRYFYQNGKTKNVVPFVGGKQDGIAYEYSQDSLIIGISTYKGGILQSYERINQRDEANKKQGVWKEFYDNLEVKRTMKFNDDSLDGYVKEYDKTGNLLSTKKYNNGKRVTRAPEIANVEVYRDVYDDGTLKYEGVYSDGLAIGTHYKYLRKKQCDSSDVSASDSIHRNVIERRLICRFVPVPDSAIEYFDGVVVARGKVDSIRNRQGIWMEYHHTGEFKGKGLYKDNNRIGDWEFFYASGNIEQKGKYDKKGRPQGQWLWYYESGQVMREENYVNGKREGELKDYDEEGKVFLEGQFVDNHKEGKWVLHTHDYYESGNYVNDEPDSLWKSYYLPSKNNYFTGRFQEGIPVGLHVWYHPNGAKKLEGTYVAGMKDGEWRYYDENEYNYLTIFYKNDIEVKWQGTVIRPTYEQSLRTYNIKIDDKKTQTIRK